MKKTLKIGVLSALLLGSLNSAELTINNAELTGDTKLSCEAILCLSTASRPSECAPSIARYFAISAKKWKDTLAKRKAFLNLCPVGDNTDTNFKSLRDNVLVNLNADCSAEALNKRTQYDIFRFDGGERKIRINPNLPSSCIALMNHSYTDAKVKYTCTGEFYTLSQWRNGRDKNNNPINKNCWVEQ